VTDTPLPTTPLQGAAHLTPEFFADPYAAFRRMREESPVTEVAMPNGQRAWLVTRYDDVLAVLNDNTRLTKHMAKLMPAQWVPTPELAFLQGTLLGVDPPDHTRLKRLVSKAFTPGRVAALRPRMAEIVEALIERMTAAAATAPDGVVDFISEFAFPLPMTVVCDMIGIPGTDHNAFKAWTEKLVSATATEQEQQTAALETLVYLSGLLDAKKAAPDDTMAYALIAARDDDDKLTDGELLSMIFLMLLAGHETTMNVVATGMLALLENPVELKKLRDDPAMLPRALDELLRYINPTNHATERYTLEPVTFGDVTIPRRELVIAVLTAANLDPSKFPDPERLDLDRDTTGHLTFGHGIHYCLGAPLARLEAEVAFSALLSRFPDLSLAVPASSLTWRPSSLIHGLERLPLRLA
jgi:cytochrome P450